MGDKERMQKQRAEIERLEGELEQAWRQVRSLKAREDKRYIDLNFSEESRELAKEVVDTLAELEYRASPLEALTISQPNAARGRASETPIPGIATSKDRAILHGYQARLRKALRYVANQEETEALGDKHVKVARPRCHECGQLGQVGWTHCPLGHGRYQL